MRTRRERIIRHIVKSADQGKPSGRAIGNWNNLPDQRRFGSDPTKLRRNLEAALPNRYSVTEDLTIGVPGHKAKKHTSPGKHSPWYKPPTQV